MVTVKETQYKGQTIRIKTFDHSKDAAVGHSKSNYLVLDPWGIKWIPYVSLRCAKNEIDSRISK
jgi:hypothetical protein